MLPFSQIKTLDALLTEATNYAEFCMRGSGRMTPALFLIGADGPLIFAPTKLDAGSRPDEVFKLLPVHGETEI